ncbi:hypothetical protein ASPACDRAFT_1855346 [Aspergillus aculeatus ATCC 16872]|uniref:Uncharacterized protein n=1 Tax=Aspergillus aculeatus (strain ATCC 16872 / CBS 172.66 / WB 5094) TaxID=690307 RepID=A0A1L9WX73_ASPA1|nr:uncharacterized protein ASPACDRAFT_1855346 [Aspergillus aculeatus ATCC 16872]OJK00800.1 hypothetical protein ASPACDRAFT_1855346 [Aspergillus aculeatus ATCC 16872]
MSRNFVPVALSIGAGVLGGYYVWQPYFKEMQLHQQHQQSLNSESTGSTAPQSQVSTSTSTPTSTHQEAVAASTTDSGVGKAAGQ